MQLYWVNFKFNFNEIFFKILFYSLNSDGYTCYVRSFKKPSTDDVFVRRVTGQHLNGLKNFDIKSFYSSSNFFTSFPKNLDKFFKNLNAIFIQDSSISTLTRNDLQPFGSKLKHFVFIHNPIEVIPADLFEDTKNLEYINLKDNN